jgi:hypothetical protein
MRRLILSTCLFLPLSTSPAQVVISEVMFDPAGPESTDEFVELFNVSPTDTVRLEGWSLGDGSASDLLSDAGAGTALDPRGYALVLDPDYFGSSTAYDSLIPEAALVLRVAGATLGSAGLSNSKPETVTLYSPDGRVADAVSYSTGNVPGHSDERIDLDRPGAEDNWADSRNRLGTPGFRNSVTPLICNIGILRMFLRTKGGSSLLIAVVANDGLTASGPFSLRFFLDVDLDSDLKESEALDPIFECSGLPPGDSVECQVELDADPGPLCAGAKLIAWNDGNPADDIRVLHFFIPYEEGCVRINEIMAVPLPGESEWIELVNAGPRAVDFRGWMFSDSDTMARRLMTEESFRLFPGEYAVLAADPLFLSDHPEIANFSLIPDRFPNLNNDSDRVYLYDPSGGQIDQARYGDGHGMRQGISLERISINGYSEDAGNWHSSLSPAGSTPGRPNSLLYDGPSEDLGFHAVPNPFSPDGDGSEDAIVMEYSLPSGNNRVRIRIYDQRGRLIRTLKNGEEEEIYGYVVWDGLDEDGHPAAIGRYIAFLESVPVRGSGRTTFYRVIVLAGRI